MYIRVLIAPVRCTKPWSASGSTPRGETAFGAAGPCTTGFVRTRFANEKTRLRRAACTRFACLQ